MGFNLFWYYLSIRKPASSHPVATAPKTPAIIGNIARPTVTLPTSKPNTVALPPWKGTAVKNTNTVPATNIAATNKLTISLEDLLNLANV